MKEKPTNDAREFWNRRAETFPRYDPREVTYESGMLDRMQAMGADFSGKRILDVGCGCGQFTIRLGMMAKAVTGLDVSEKMLSVLQEDAEKYGLKNIEYMRSDWLDFTPQKPYDMVFCTMTPALRTDEGKEQLLTYAGAQVVYMGFQERHHSDMLREFYALHKEEARGCDSAVYMKAWLDEKKISYKRETVTGQWESHTSFEDAVSRLMASGFNFENPPSEEEVRAFIRPFANEDGIIFEVSKYVIDIIIWQNA